LRLADPMTSEDSRMAGYSARELLLAAAARAVLAAFREPIAERRLTPRTDASLRVLETALYPYPRGRLDDPDK